MYEMTKKAEKCTEVITRVITIMTCAGALVKALADLVDYLYPEKEEN